MVTNFLNIKTNKKTELPLNSNEIIEFVKTKPWILKKNTTKGTRYPFFSTPFYTLQSKNLNTVKIESKTTTHSLGKQSKFTTKKSFIIPNIKTKSNNQSSIIDYCKILNCDFNGILNILICLIN